MMKDIVSPLTEKLQHQQQRASQTDTDWGPKIGEIYLRENTLSD